MAISAEKAAPSVIVLAFVGYCMWPSASALISEPPRPKPPEKVPELAASLFSPNVAPNPTRNPWGGKDAETLAKIREANKIAQEQEAEEKLAAESAETPAIKPTLQPVDLLKGLTLDATCIGNNQRLAIINNRLYALQEMLKDIGPDAPPCKIVDVRPYEVLLEYMGTTLELKYSSASPPATSKDAGEDVESDLGEQPAERTPAAKKKL